MSVVGFDFGNQDCYVAVARQGGIEVVTNDYSQRATPRVMGVAARQKILSNLKNTVFSFKNLIGREFKDPVVQQEMHSLPYKLVELPDHSVGVEVEYGGSKRIFTSEQLAAIMLHKLREIAEAYLRTKVVDCVISVPCYWTDRQRRAMLDAASVLGLNVLRLMNETTAVALTYGIYKQDLPEETEKPRLVCFVDMGHSQTQVSICAFNKGKLKMLDVQFDPTLGGRNFDAVIRESFNEEFKTKFRLDSRQNAKAWIRLGDEVEKLKKQMSGNSNVIPLNIECFMDDKDVNAKIKRDEFDEKCEELYGRFENLMKRLLQDSKIKPQDVESVEIVGGSTRIKAIQQVLQKLFGKEPSTTLNADEAVSRGCALMCAILSPTFRVREFSITDIQPFSIKLNWTADKGDEGEAEVFPEHHAFPFSKMLTFYRREPFFLEASYTYPNHIPYPNTMIGRFRILNVVPQADGSSSKIKVKVRINPNGIFTVSSASMVEKLVPGAVDDEEPMESEDQQPPASTPASQKQQNGEAQSADVQNGPGAEAEAKKSETESSGKDEKSAPSKEPPKPKIKSYDLPIDSAVPQLAAQDLKKFQDMELQMQIADRTEKEMMDAKNALEEYVYEMRGKLGERYQDFIKQQDADQFQSMLESVENWLYDEGAEQPKQVYQDRLAELKKWGDPVHERYVEAQERPHAFESLAHSLQMAQKIYDSWVGRDPKYDHLDGKDMEKVHKAIQEKYAWLDRETGAQNRRHLHEPPAVFASQIRSEKEAFERIVNPILNKSKPAPPPPPPADDKKQSGPGSESQKTGDDPNRESKEASMDVD